MPNKQYVLVYGNPLDGFRIVGPLAESIAAHDAGSRLEEECWCDPDYFWVAELERPNDNP